VLTVQGELLAYVAVAVSVFTVISAPAHLVEYPESGVLPSLSTLGEAPGWSRSVP
jgi:hypothetical protein